MCVHTEADVYIPAVMGLGRGEWGTGLFSPLTGSPRKNGSYNTSHSALLHSPAITIMLSLLHLLKYPSQSKYMVFGEKKNT